jgi:hypothetical protein
MKEKSTSKGKICVKIILCTFAMESKLALQSEESMKALEKKLCDIINNSMEPKHA